MSLKGKVTIQVFHYIETIQGRDFERVDPAYVPRQLQQQHSYNPGANLRYYKAKAHTLNGDPEIYAIAEVSFSGAALSEVGIYIEGGDIPADEYWVTGNTLASTGHTPY